MPRTKAPRKTKINNKKPDTFLSSHIQKVQETRDSIKQELQRIKEDFYRKLNAHFTEVKLSIPLSIANKTIGELMNNSHSSTFSTTASILEILEVTKTRKRARSSRSAGDDEAESVSGTSGGRKSRSKVRQVKPPRLSRSLTLKKSRTSSTVGSKYKTPSNRAPNPNSYAMVTPKVAPNTPQVLLRRPQMGEVALSLQGSPLFTGSVISETVANVNIPLEGGRMLSIQPQRGLRTSQIPDLDPETKRQLQMLRDNLNKVCAAAGVRR